METGQARRAAWIGPPVGGRLQEMVRRHRFVAYIAVAYALSWSFWIVQAMSGQVVVAGGTTTHVPGLFGPMLAGFLIVAIADGRTGLWDMAARMVRWRTRPRWYALACVPFLLFLGGVGLTAAGGGEVPTLDDLGRYSGLPEMGLPAVVLLAFLANGYGEEVGWRGFAQPTLRSTRGFLSASVAVATAWALWHAPSFWIVETYRIMGLSLIPVFVIGLGSGAIVFGWLYERSGASILIVALAHLGLNMGSATVAGRGLPQMMVTTGIVVWAALIVAGEVRRGGGTRRLLDRLGRRLTGRLLRSRAGRGLALATTIVTDRGPTSGRVNRPPAARAPAPSRLSWS